MSKLAKNYDGIYEHEGLGRVDLQMRGWPRDRNHAAVAFAGSGQRVLDVGCGNGLVLYNLRHRFQELYGVELSPGRVQKARETLTGLNATVLQGNIEAGLPFRDGFFDTIVIADVIEHVVNIFPAFAELTRLLRPGGRVDMSTPNIAKLRGRLMLLRGRFPSTALGDEGLAVRGPLDLLDSGHLHYFTFSMLDRLFARYGFREVKHYGFGRFGRLHTLYPSLLSTSCQVVAVK